MINICLELEAFLEHYLRCASNGLQAVAASLSPKIQSTLINILDSISQIISCSSKFQTKPAALTVSISSIPLIPKAKYPTSFRGRWHAGSEQNKLVSVEELGLQLDLNQLAMLEVAFLRSLYRNCKYEFWKA